MVSQKKIDYLVLFLRGMARSASDAALLKATEKLDTAHRRQQQLTSYLAQPDDLIQARLAQRWVFEATKISGHCPHVSTA